MPFCCEINLVRRLIKFHSFKLQLPYQVLKLLGATFQTRVLNEQTEANCVNITHHRQFKVNTFKQFTAL